VYLIEKATTKTIQKENNMRLYTVQEVAKILNVPVSWLYERSRHDALKNLGMRRCGKYLRFSAEAVTEFIERGGDLD
jgi:excisionase family DNA binding protein